MPARALLLMSALALASSCGAVHFDVTQPIPAQTVPGNPFASFLTQLLPAPLRLTIDVQMETQKQGTGPATSAGLRALRLRAMNTGTTFDFLDEVSVYAEAPGLPKVEVARARPVPRGQSTLEFSVWPQVDVLPYLNQGATLTTTSTGSVPATNFSFNGEVVVEIRI